MVRLQQQEGAHRLCEAVGPQSLRHPCGRNWKTKELMLVDARPASYESPFASCCCAKTLPQKGSDKKAVASRACPCIPSASATAARCATPRASNHFGTPGGTPKAAAGSETRVREPD